MLRSMADPFELNVTSLSVPIREKAKEQSPPALLFCIRINHFPLLCPEHSGGHFKSFLLGSVELCLDLCRGCRGNKTHHNTDQQRHQEGRQQLVDAKHAAQRADDVLPYKDHQAAGEHTGQCALPVAALPEQGAQHHCAKGAAKAGPCKADDAEHAGVGVAGQHHAHHADADDGQAGSEQALLLGQLHVAELLQDVLGDAGRGSNPI